MEATSRFALGFAPDRPSLLHAGLGRGWWWVGRPVVADAHRLWVLGPDHALAVAFPGAQQVGSDGPILVGASGARSVRIDLSAATAQFHDHGRDRAVPGGRARVWVDEEAGYVYRATDRTVRAVAVLGPGERVEVGPDGALLIGRGAYTRGGAPGRSPRPLPVAVGTDPIRWSQDGRRIAALDVDGAPVGVDLDPAPGRSAKTAGPSGGVPVAADAWLADARIVRGDGVLWRGLTEASAARWGTWLAGPGGWVWCLRRGRPVHRRRVIALGATVGTPEGFVTVDWETGRGWTVTWTGRRERPFVLPLEPDDTVTAGLWADDAVHFATALGATFAVDKGQVSLSTVPVPHPSIAPSSPSLTSPLDTPAGPLDGASLATVDGITFAYDDDGWLLSWPSRSHDRDKVYPTNTAPFPPHS